MMNTLRMITAALALSFSACTFAPQAAESGPDAGAVELGSCLRTRNGTCHPNLAPPAPPPACGDLGDACCAGECAGDLQCSPWDECMECTEHIECSAADRCVDVSGAWNACCC